MSANPFAVLKRLLAGGPLQVGTVTLVDDSGAVTVQLPGGSNVLVRGQATAGDTVFFRDGVIEGPAPALPFGTIEV